MTSWYPFERRRCKFVPRAEYDGRRVMPALAELSGTVCNFEALWIMDEDDPYTGEWAIKPMADAPDALRERGWIASGDVQDLTWFERIKYNLAGK